MNGHAVAAVLVGQKASEGYSDKGSGCFAQVLGAYTAQRTQGSSCKFVWLGPGGVGLFEAPASLRASFLGLQADNVRLPPFTHANTRIKCVC